MKNIIKRNRNYFHFYLVIFLFVFISGCGGVTPASPVITSFTADSTTINEGESVGLSWVVTDASTVMINQGIGDVALTGSTSVSPAVTTTYVLTATSSTGSNIATITITVNQAVIIEQTAIVQPGPTEGKDADVSSAAVNNNYAHYADLFIGNTPDPYTSRAYLQFDLSAIPAGANIVSADLKIYHYSTTGSTDFTIGMHKVTGNWQENTITWNNQPAYLPITESTRLINTDKNGWISWDITALLQGWIDGDIINYGVVLRKMDELLGGTYIKCRSSDYSIDSTQHPKLEITYYIPE